ncbi:Flp pilus assembly protein CpaB [Pusillimonas sp. TS35]|nr:Flp pilus assembly protein CpaB [Pusillimonas sp. TS35]
MNLPRVPSSWLLAFFAVAAGGCAAWAAQRYLHQQAAMFEARHSVQMVDRIVAADDLAEGTVLHAGLLAVRAFPLPHVAADSIAPAQSDTLEGAALRAAVRAGDALLPVHVGPPRSAGLAVQLQPGRRAVTLPVDASNTPAGLIQAGDLVDLYVSFSHQRRKVTAPLLQRVRVLAAGGDTGPSTEAGATTGALDALTLDASPAEAMTLIAARDAGTITAMLRAPEDTGSSNLATRGDLASLLGIGGPAVPARPQVIYGNKAARGLSALNSNQAAKSAGDSFFQLSSNALASVGQGSVERREGNTELAFARHTVSAIEADSPMSDEDAVSLTSMSDDDQEE